VDGALAGLVVDREAQLALVPADTVVAIAERLAREGQTQAGWLGIEVQPLTPLTAAATGAAVGVIVSWIDPQGPAARDLRVADVVERVDGQPMTTVEHWLARTARVTFGESLPITVRRGGVVHDLHLTATARTGGNDRPLGLAFRTIPRIGVEVMRVDAGSAAYHADLRIGDVLTLVGDVEHPTTSQASRAFATASKERPLIIGVARAGRHHVVAIERTW
jgi:S1-C subfamily serine protease